MDAIIAFAQGTWMTGSLASTYEPPAWRFNMSLTVLLVGVAHGIPVVIARGVSGKGGAVVAAVIMAGVAAVTGGSQYLIFDLMGIGLGLWIAMSI